MNEGDKSTYLGIYVVNEHIFDKGIFSAEHYIQYIFLKKL